MVALYEVARIGKFMKTESGRVLARGQGRGGGDLFWEYRISILPVGEGTEDCLHSSVNTLNTIELHTQKWLSWWVSCYVYFTIINFFIKKDKRGKTWGHNSKKKSSLAMNKVAAFIQRIWPWISPIIPKFVQSKTHYFHRSHLNCSFSHILNCSSIITKTGFISIICYC